MMYGIECFFEINEKEEEGLVICSRVVVFFVEGAYVCCHLTFGYEGCLTRVNDRIKRFD